MTSDIRLPAADLIDFVARLFAAKGMSGADAAQVADLVVWADARGAGSHGVTRVPNYLRFIDEGSMDPKAQPTIESRAGAIFTVEAKQSAGAVAMMLALTEGEKRAKANGIALGLVSNTTHTGAIGYYAAWAAERGLAAVIFNVGPPNMAYHGTRVASLATSPIAIGVPGEGDPLVLDMATSLVANGKLMQARDAGVAIPDDWALTGEGARTTDPSLAEILLPLGGPKGSGLALMFECLTGVLGTNPILSAQVGPGAKRRHTANATLILIDIEAFRPLADYKRDIAALRARIKTLPRLDSETEVLMPGERGAREAQRQARDGVVVSRAAWKRLVAAAEKLGVAAPAPAG